jgi:4-amino-4-deoxy-L-arabinose transferase-like glycosyltransferase
MTPAAARRAAWPIALVPCLRLVWQRALFPAAADPDRRVRLRSLALLVVLPGLLLYPWLRFHLLEPDEGRYAEIGREMLQRGDWVVPTLQGEPYLDKPPLFYWLIVLSYRVFGVHDWAARVAPALAVHGTILVTYLFGRRLLGERAAFRGALLLSLTPGLVGTGRLLVLDGLLTFWVTLGLFAGVSALQAHPLRRVGFWVCAAACGFGVLTKGPVALVLVLPPLVAYGWLQGLRTTDYTLRTLAAFAAVVLAINLPWYAAVAVARPEFGFHFFVRHNLQRFLVPFDHLQPIWYYAPVAFVGLLPGAVLGWRFARWLVARDAAAARGRPPGLGLCLLAGGWCVLFFSLSGSKLPTYILPAFPPLALALGCYWANVSARGGGRVFTAFLGMWSVLLLAVHAVGFPWYAALRSPLGSPGAEVRAECADPAVPVFCFPRTCDSASFYLGRDDFQSTRTKNVQSLFDEVKRYDRAVVLVTHRHSIAVLRSMLPPELRVAKAVSFRHDLPGPAWVERLLGDTPWGLCDLVVIERTGPRPNGS